MYEGSLPLEKKMTRRLKRKTGKRVLEVSKKYIGDIF